MMGQDPNSERDSSSDPSQQQQQQQQQQQHQQQQQEHAAAAEQQQHYSTSPHQHSHHHPSQYAPSQQLQAQQQQRHHHPSQQQQQQQQHHHQQPLHSPTEASASASFYQQPHPPSLPLPQQQQQQQQLQQHQQQQQHTSSQSQLFAQQHQQQQQQRLEGHQESATAVPPHLEFPETATSSFPSRLSPSSGGSSSSSSFPASHTTPELSRSLPQFRDSRGDVGGSGGYGDGSTLGGQQQMSRSASSYAAYEHLHHQQQQHQGGGGGGYEGQSQSWSAGHSGGHTGPQQLRPLPQSSFHSSTWQQPRPTSAPSAAVPMFGERLHQRASMQLANIPHIPNIVVDAVPARDHFGHSRTPPFVQSDWASKWGLHVPSSSKKLRTNSDSAIYEAEREEQHQKKGGYIPQSWELLSFRDSQEWNRPQSEHIKSSGEGADPTAAEQFTYQSSQQQPQQSSAHHYGAPIPATQFHPPSQERRRSRSSPPQAMDVDTEEKQALNLSVSVPSASQQQEQQQQQQQQQELGAASGHHLATSPTPQQLGASPTVPFIWKFQAVKSSESPKTTWLRRHSDSTLSTEPEDLSIPKSSAAARSRSSGETISEEKVEMTEQEGVEEGVRERERESSGGATGESTSGTEGAELQSPKDPGQGGDLLSKRLKLKKYLQKRYQLSLESAPRHHSTESDDVFSPSPGVFSHGQSFVFSPTLTEDDISPRPQRPSPLASSSRSSPSRGALSQSSSYSKPLEIKTEPISPISSESEEETDAGVFLSPADISPHSVSPTSQGLVFQFHSPTSYSRSSGSEKSPDSSHLRYEEGFRRRRTPQPPVSPESISQSPSTYSESVAMESSVASPGLAVSKETPNVEILRQGRLSPLASMLSHPSFTHPNMHSFSGSAPPLTPPFASYQTSSKSSSGERVSPSSHGGAMYSPSAAAGSSASAAAGSAWQASQRQPGAPSASGSIPGRTRSMSETDKPLEPSKIIYCPFSEKVQEQRYQREMTFLCPVCGQMFPSYNYLANHMVNHLPSEVVSKGPGEGNKVHLCKVCNRSFSRSDMLTRHMRLHTGLRPYECRMCGQVFSRSDHLHTHLRTHTGEKPYRCPQCPYAAPRRDMITRHMRIHTKHFSRRGRRSSSTGSADTLHSSSFSSLESGDSDVKKRNQSLSSMGSEGSTEASPFRRTSGAGFEPMSEPGGVGDPSKPRQWSLTSAESADSAVPEFATVGTPTRKYPRQWSLTSIESVDVPASSVASSSEGSSSQLTMLAERSGGGTLSQRGSSSAASMESGGEDSRGMDTGRDTPAAQAIELQSSFQKCHVGSDRESESEHGSPARAMRKENQ